MKFSFSKKRFFTSGCRYIFLLCFLLNACSTFREQQPLQTTERLAKAQGWEELYLSATPFSLRSYLSPRSVSNGALTIYIEGDGSAWDRGQYPSEDPTPKDPIGLKLALAHPDGAVAYLARPCQYVADSTLCKSKVWTSERFSQPAVQSTNQAINLLKIRTGAQKIVLVGYSGGAAIALLAAAQRNDVQSIIAVAGNVNPHLWVDALGLEPLSGSLDPRTVISSITPIPQVYFTGGRDRVLAPMLTEEWIKLFPNNSRPSLVQVEENGHVCCWVEQWPLLWTQFIQNAANLK